MTEFAHRLGLDLANPLSGDAIDLADLVQRLGLTVGEAEPHRYDARLPLAQGVQDGMELLLQERERHRVRWDDRFGVLDQVAELAVAVLAERRVERDGLAAVLLDLDDLLRRLVQLEGQ